MVVNATSIAHKNSVRFIWFSYLNASNFICKYAVIGNYYSIKNISCISELKKRPNRHICAGGVAGRRQDVNNCVFRCAGTDSTTLTARFQKFRKILYDFYLGGKSLFQDVKVTWKIRRKLRENGWNYDVLKREELWKMFETLKNIKKTLPIVALSFLPVVGYLGPIIGFLRPRQFLSSHFWTAKQKDKFKLLDGKQREESRSFIFKVINEETKQLGSKECQLLHKITARVELDHDAPFEKTLEAFSTGPFELDNLERIHLRKLCSFWIMRTLWPRFLLKRSLKNEMMMIHKDDIALDREGVEVLNEKELKQACHVRGLDTSNISSKDLQIWLQDWIHLTKNVSENKTSYLAHHAVFKSISYQETLKDKSTS